MKPSCYNGAELEEGRKITSVGKGNVDLFNLAFAKARFAWAYINMAVELQCP